MLNSRELNVFHNQTDGQTYKQISYKQKSVIMKVLQNEAIRLLQYYEALSMLKPLRISIQLHSAFLCLSVALHWAKAPLPITVHLSTITFFKKMFGPSLLLKPAHIAT